MRDVYATRFQRGRFKNAGPAYRSKLIARTETKWAQNESSLVAYEAAEDITKVVAYDAQLGASRSDPDCIARNGREFNIKDARVELSKEHPNGTLSFAPIVNPGARPGQDKPLSAEDARAFGDSALPDSVKPHARQRNVRMQPLESPLRVSNRVFSRVDEAPAFSTTPRTGLEARQRLAAVHEPYAQAAREVVQEIEDLQSKIIREWIEYDGKLALRREAGEISWDQYWDAYMDYYENVVIAQREESQQLYNLLNSVVEARQNAMVKAIEHRRAGASPNFQLQTKEEFTWRQFGDHIVPTSIDDAPVEWADIEHLQGGTNIFRRLVNDWPDDNAGIDFHITPRRAYQTGTGNRNSAIYYEGRGSGFDPTENWGTIVHEMGHALGTADTDVLQDAVDFLYSRVGNEKQRRMRDLTGLPYDRREVTRPDQFFDPYVGKEYSYSRKGWKRYFGDEGLEETVQSPWNKKDIVHGEEVVSMGLQHMWDDAWEFSKLDPGHFDFIFERIMYRNLLDLPTDVSRFAYDTDSAAFLFQR